MNFAGNHGYDDSSAAKCGAIRDGVKLDACLQAIVDALLSLPDSDRAAVLAIVGAKANLVK
jgi:hypothetical protein